MLLAPIGARKWNFVNRHSFSGMTGNLQFTLREWLSWLRPGQQVAWLLGAVAVLAYLGPFDTWGSLSLFDRVMFWTLAAGANWLFGMFIGAGAVAAFVRRGWPSWVGIIVAGSAVVGVPGTGIVWLLIDRFMDQPIAGAAAVMSLYFQVTGLHAVLNVIVTSFIIRDWRSRNSRDSPLPEVTSDPPADAPFLRRLPARLGRNLLHLRMQDHYVEAHTDTGNDLILLRFRDALREVASLDGAQVHRSHWVARAAVAGIERRDGRIALRLVNGSRVPVSRSFAPDLRGRGWI